MRERWKSLTLPQALLIIFGVCVLLAAVFCAFVFLFFFAARTGVVTSGPQHAPVIIQLTPVP